MRDLLFVCLFALFAINIHAADVNDLKFDVNFDDGNFIITDCAEDASGSLVIPNSIEGRLVIGIAAYAFSDCKSLTHISIPNGVTHISSHAFFGCTSLHSITIPDTVTSFDNNAFSNCVNLGSITIPNSVTQIGEAAFNECISLRSVTIPKSVNSIGTGAFNGCDKLRVISFLSSNPPLNVANSISDSSKIAIRINPDATGFGEMLGGLPIIDPDSITSIESVELDKHIVPFPDGNGELYNVSVKVIIRSDVPVEFVQKSLFGPEGAVYENDIVTEFEKGRFPDGGIQPDVWIFKWLDNIPNSMPEGSYTYGKINVTNFDGIISEDWSDVSFLYNKIESFTPERPEIFDGNFVNWEFVDSNNGYGFFADQDVPYFKFNVTGDIEDLSARRRDVFDYQPFESLFGDADNVENFRIQSNGKAHLNMHFSDTVNPFTIGFSLTDLEYENVIIRAWHKGKRISRKKINQWFRDVFDSSRLDTNKPSWDPKHNAIVAQWDADGFLSDEIFTSFRPTESASAWFVPNVPFDSLSLEYHHRLSGRSSMHVYFASSEINPSDLGPSLTSPAIIDSDIKLMSDNKVRIFLPNGLGDFFIQSSTDLQNWKTISGSLSSESFFSFNNLNYIFEEKHQKKALVPTEDIGNDWIQLNYDDSNWLDVESVSEDGTLVGGGVGYARSGTRVDPFDPYIALDLEEQMWRINASVYIRIPFTVDNLSEIRSLILAARTDDGFVAWINGEKVLSFNAPDEPQWDSEATASNSDSIAQNLKEFSLDDHIDKLRVGENIIAIQALSRGKSGSDFLFSCVLGMNKKDYFSIDYPITIPTKFHRAIKK